MTLIRYQPFKALYGALFICLLVCIRLPFWCFLNFFPRFRLHPKYTYVQDLWIRIANTLTKDFITPLGLGAALRYPPSFNLSERERFRHKGAPVSVVPAIEEVRLIDPVHRWMSETDVRPVEVGGFWSGDRADSCHVQGSNSQPKALSGEKVIMYFHGGCYLIGTANPFDPQSRAPKRLVEECRARKQREPTLDSSATLPTSAFSVEYRKSDASPWPAQIIDAISAFDYLVKLGFEAHNIILMGNSAGAHLATALIRYIQDHNSANGEKGWGSPTTCILVSPWMDLTLQLDKAKGSSFKKRQGKEDFITYPFINRGIQSLLRGFKDPSSITQNVYMSPCGPRPMNSNDPHMFYESNELKNVFPSWPSTYIVAGGIETLLDHALVLYDRLHHASDLRDLPKHSRTLLSHHLNVVADVAHDPLALPFGWNETIAKINEDIVNWLSK